MVKFIKAHLQIFSICIIGLILFLPTLTHGFVWDDEEQVVNNQAVQSIKNIPDLFGGSTFNSGGGGYSIGMYYKPMMSVVFAILYSLSGGKAWLFHFLQVCLHIVNALLVYAIFKNLFAKEKYANSIGWWSSLVFLIHPINVESVVYISALQDTLFFFFGSFSLFLIISFRYLNKVILYPSFGCLLFLSLLSKETGIVWFFIIPIYYLLFDKKPKMIRDYFILATYAFIFYVFLRFGVAQVGLNKTEGISPMMRVEWWQRLMSLPKALSYYLENFFFPNRLAVAQHWIVDKVSLTDFWLPMVLVGLLAVLLIGLYFLVREQKKLLLLYYFFSIWFLLGLGIHSQIIPLDMTVADRWFYLPVVGLLGLLNLSIIVALQKFKRPRAFFVIGGLIVLILFVRSFIRVGNWKDGLTLFGRDINISTNAFDLENNYGVELFRAGRLEEAKVHFVKSTELAPYWWSNWNNLGVVYQREGNLEKALELYQLSMDKSDYYLAYQNYLSVLIGQNKLVEAEEFLRNKALPRFPYNSYLLGTLYYLQNQPASQSAIKTE